MRSIGYVTKEAEGVYSFFDGITRFYPHKSMENVSEGFYEITDIQFNGISGNIFWGKKIKPTKITIEMIRKEADDYNFIYDELSKLSIRTIHDNEDSYDFSVLTMDEEDSFRKVYFIGYENEIYILINEPYADYISTYYKKKIDSSIVEAGTNMLWFYYDNLFNGDNSRYSFNMSNNDIDCILYIQYLMAADLFRNKFILTGDYFGGIGEEETINALVNNELLISSETTHEKYGIIIYKSGLIEKKCYGPNMSYFYVLKTFNFYEEYEIDGYCDVRENMYPLSFLDANGDILISLSQDEHDFLLKEIFSDDKMEMAIPYESVKDEIIKRSVFINAHFDNKSQYRTLERFTKEELQRENDLYGTIINLDIINKLIDYVGTFDTLYKYVILKKIKICDNIIYIAIGLIPGAYYHIGATIMNHLQVIIHKNNLFLEKEYNEETKDGTIKNVNNKDYEKILPKNIYLSNREDGDSLWN